jgi:hypothetical protein
MITSDGVLSVPTTAETHGFLLALQADTLSASNQKQPESVDSFALYRLPLQQKLAQLKSVVWYRWGRQALSA